MLNVTILCPYRLSLQNREIMTFYDSQQTTDVCDNIDFCKKMLTKIILGQIIVNCQYVTYKNKYKTRKKQEDKKYVRPIRYCSNVN